MLLSESAPRHHLALRQPYITLQMLRPVTDEMVYFTTGCMGQVLTGRRLSAQMEFQMV